MIYEKTFPNGLELVVKKTAAPVVSVQCWVDVGSVDEKPNEAGWCHYLEHMLFKGTKKRTTQQIAADVEGSGGEFNAFTSFEYTVYYINISNQKWSLANDILSDMLTNSQFYPSEFNPEKEVILEEVKRGEDSPDRVLYQSMYRQFYGASGYGKPVIGFPKTVKGATPSTLKGFFKKWYQPSLMTVVIAGDVDVNEVSEVIAKTWGKSAGARAPRKRRRETGFHSNLAKPTKLQHATHFDVNSIRWAAAVPCSSVFDPKVAALDVSSIILGHGESSRLHQRLFRDENLVTSVSSSAWTPAGSGMYYFDVDAPVENEGKFHASLFDEVKKYCSEGPTKAELDRVKASLESDRIYSRQAMEDVANRMGYLKTVLGNTRYDLEYNAEMRELTTDDVRDAARKYLEGKDFLECALLPRNHDAAKFWSSCFNGADAPKATKSSGKKSAPKKQEVPYERHFLSNGIELLMFPRTDVPVISIQSAVLGGLRSETVQNAGIGALLSDVWGQGPKGWSAEKFSAFLESKATHMDAFSGRNSTGMSCTTITQNLDEVLPLFIETTFNPELAVREFEQAKTVALEEIKTLEDNGAKLCSKNFSETMFEGHPYSFPGVGYEKSVRALDLAQISKHHKRLVGDSRMVVTLAGKFNPSRVLQAFESIKRNAKPATEKVSIETLAFTPPLAPRLVEAKKNREQSHILIGYEGPKITDKTRYSMKVLMTVLGGMSGRLFREIRDKKGLCYTVAPTMFEGIEPGYVGVYIGTDPAKREQAIAGIHEELNKIATKPITKEELIRAKEYILGRHHMDLQMNSAIASSVTFNAVYGLPFDEHLHWAERLKEVDQKSIQKLASSLFTQASVTSIVV